MLEAGLLPSGLRLRPEDLRYEVKLVCDRQTPADIRSWLRLHPAGWHIARPVRRVNRVYFDTARLQGLLEHRSGVAHRMKVRLHWNGDAWPIVSPWLELKVRLGVLNAKPRWPLAPLDLSCPWSRIVADIQTGLEPSVAPAVLPYRYPTILAHYRREQYATPDGRIKLTLDYDQRAFDQRRAVRPDRRRALQLAGSVVIEVKGPCQQGERIAEIVSAFPVRRSRHSKYVAWMESALGGE